MASREILSRLVANVSAYKVVTSPVVAPGYAAKGVLFHRLSRFPFRERRPYMPPGLLTGLVDLTQVLFDV